MITPTLRGGEGGEEEGEGERGEEGGNEYSYNISSLLTAHLANRGDDNAIHKNTAPLYITSINALRNMSFNTSERGGREKGKGGKSNNEMETKGEDGREGTGEGSRKRHNIVRTLSIIT